MQTSLLHLGVRGKRERLAAGYKPKSMQSFRVFLAMLYSIQDTNIDTEEHKVQPFLSIINPKIFPF